MSGPNGNAIFVDLVTEPIVLGDYESRLNDPDVGSHGWFLGVTRRTTVVDQQTTTTSTLHYEAKRSMAIAQLLQIAEQAKSRFGLTAVVLIHRLGEVPVGQSSVLVGCSSPHRRQTFDAMPWIMDRLKRDVPIWKKEEHEDGQTQWVHPGLNQ